MRKEIPPLKIFEKDVANILKEINRLKKGLNQRMKRLSLDDIIKSLDPNKFELYSGDTYHWEYNNFSVDFSYDEGTKAYRLYIEVDKPVRDIPMMRNFHGKKAKNHPKIIQFYKEIEKDVEEGV